MASLQESHNGRGYKIRGPWPFLRFAPRAGGPHKMYLTINRRVPESCSSSFLLLALSIEMPSIHGVNEWPFRVVAFDGHRTFQNPRMRMVYHSWCLRTLSCGPKMLYQISAAASQVCIELGRLEHAKFAIRACQWEVSLKPVSYHCLHNHH